MIALVIELRLEISRKYDYRHSQMAFVFGRLVKEERVSLRSLEGLSEGQASRHSLRRLAPVAGFISIYLHLYVCSSIKGNK